MGAWDFHSLEGLARSLDGSADYFSCASSAALNPGAADFAICGFVRLDVAASYNLFTKWGAVGNYGYTLYIVEAAGALEPNFAVSSDGTAIQTVAPAADLMDAEVWHFIAAWFDQSAGDTFVEVDRGTTYTEAGAIAGIYDSTADLMLGAGTGASFKLDGRMAKWGLWIGSFPTEAQRTLLYNGGKGLTRYTLPDALLTNLVEWWDGDETAGSNLLGAVNGYDLTKAGAPGTAAGPDVADVLSLAHPHGPGVSVEIGSQANVIVAETVGGRLRAQERGGDRRTYTLPFPAISATHKGSLDTWWARYGGAREPFLLELPDGTRVRVRAPQTRLTYAHLGNNYYRATVELVEDLI